MDNNQMRNLLEQLEQQDLINVVVSNERLIKYNFVNRSDTSLKGELVVSPNFEVFYLSFAGLSNKHFARGEALDVADVKKFILSAAQDNVQFGKTILGKSKIILNDITLDMPLD